MIQTTIMVENIKCQGCVNTIKNALLKTPSIHQVTVDVEQGQVRIAGENLDKENLANLLLSLGYPEKGSVAGIEALKAKGKSFVSCAIGRMSD
jgi:copper chaperone